MQRVVKKFSMLLAAFWGLITTAPFAVLESFNRPRFSEEVPITVFIFMWILQTFFALLLVPVVKTIRSKKPFSKYSIGFFVQIAALTLIVYIWIGWVVDQWPCFVGVSNCD